MGPEQLGESRAIAIDIKTRDSTLKLMGKQIQRSIKRKNQLLSRLIRTTPRFDLITRKAVIGIPRIGTGVVAESEVPATRSVRSFPPHDRRDVERPVESNRPKGVDEIAFSKRVVC
ncbi:MAG: hypothetical protein A3H28_03025 [Acidobacteria bacterium RIFCSPLOWO2_02_FULL_61_28]|nr:MAG: hypothetical protein A3H28_03025 [Acidobacteria bacterium RIFCSPLOWO2_02_FULL_61_28]